MCIVNSSSGLRTGARAMALLSILAAFFQQAPAQAQPQPGQAAPGRGAAVRPPASPEIHPDKTVTFRLSAPKAAEVTLNGSWEGARDIKMTKDDDCVWSVTV